MATKMNDKLVIITGGSSGIGLEIGKRFSALGARIIAVGRNNDHLAKAIKVLGPHAEAITCDVTDDAQLQDLFARYERVDHLVTCAGGTVFGTIEEVTPGDMRELFASRVFGQMSAARFAIPRMGEGSSIIFCSGIGDVVGLEPYAAGCAVDGAINAFARSLAVELGARGIRVNAVSPGSIGNTGIDPAKGGEHIEGFNRRALARIPLQRFGTPSDVADAAVYFATAPYATGQVIEVDGGWSAT